MEVDLPEPVRQRANAGGAAGRRWLDDLPGVVERLLQEWDLVPGRTLGGGTAAYVAEVRDADGETRILKVAMVLDEDDEIAAFDHSITALGIADGRGCVAMLASDRERHAVLLERLGSNLDVAGTPVDEILVIVTDTLREFWRPAALDSTLPSGPEKATWLADFIVASWNDLGRPCDIAVVDRALDCCARRSDAFDERTAVLVHGDAHGWNTCVVPDGGHKLVDPEGLRSERAHDLGALSREYNDPLLAGDTPRLVRDRAQLLADRCGIDAEPVFEWGFIERVSTGMANLVHLDGDGGQAYLVVAERSR